MRHATALHLGYAQKIICRTHDKQDINREKPTNNSIPRREIAIPRRGMAVSRRGIAISRRGTDYLTIFSCFWTYCFVSLQVGETNLI